MKLFESFVAAEVSEEGLGFIEVLHKWSIFSAIFHVLVRFWNISH